jgi:ribosomal protein L37E
MIKGTKQTIQWPKEKDRQYNGQKKKTDNTMIKGTKKTIQWPKEKDRQYNGQMKKTDNTMIKSKRQTIISKSDDVRVV